MFGLKISVFDDSNVCAALRKKIKQKIIFEIFEGAWVMFKSGVIVAAERELSEWHVPYFCGIQKKGSKGDFLSFLIVLFL